MERKRWGEGKKERMLTTTKTSPRSFPLHQGSKTGMSVPYTVFPIAATPSSGCPGKAAPWTEFVSGTPGQRRKEQGRERGSCVLRELGCSLANRFLAFCGSRDLAGSCGRSCCSEVSLCPGDEGLIGCRLKVAIRDNPCAAVETRGASLP